MNDYEAPPGESKKCVECQRVLELGVDVLCVEEGVIGPRGIVPLKDLLFFCSDPCVAEYFGAHVETTKLSRRVP